MKRLFMFILCVFIAVVVISGCSDDSDKTNNNENGSAATEKNDKDATEENKEKKSIYQIGETAKTKSNSYGYPYEVTVNKFEITSEDVEEKSLKDLGYEAGDEAKFAVANVTIKNTGEKSFVPNETMTAGLVSDVIGERPSDKFFKEGDSELKPGDSVTGNMVYTSPHFYKSDVLYLVYEEAATDEEVKFELPVSKK